jgi:hypothetical protein
MEEWPGIAIANRKMVRNKYLNFATGKELLIDS